MYSLIQYITVGTQNIVYIQFEYKYEYRHMDLAYMELCFIKRLAYIPIWSYTKGMLRFPVATISNVLPMTHTTYISR